MSTATRPRKSKSAPNGAHRRPPSERPPDDALNVRIIPPSGPERTAPSGPTLQETLNGAAPSGPEKAAPDSAAILAEQTALFNSAIGRDKRLGALATQTAIGMGGDICAAFDVERPFCKPGDIRKAWGRMVGAFGRLYEIERSKTARTSEWVRAFQVFNNVGPESQTIISGDDSAPFDLDTLLALSDWLDNDEKSATWAIRDGFADDLNAMIRRVADDSLSAAKTRDAMRDVERGREMARIETLNGPERRNAESDLATTRKADRTKKVTSAIEGFKKAVESVKSASGKGMRTAEILVELERAGIIDTATRPVDPATMSPAEALDFAETLFNVNPGAAHVVRETLNRLAASVPSRGTAPSAAPCLNDAPGTNGAAK